MKVQKLILMATDISKHYVREIFQHLLDQFQKLLGQMTKRIQLKHQLHRLIDEMLISLIIKSIEIK